MSIHISFETSINSTETSCHHITFNIHAAQLQTHVPDINFPEPHRLPTTNANQSEFRLGTLYDLSSVTNHCGATRVTSTAGIQLQGGPSID